jgi:hypothetical protein
MYRAFSDIIRYIWAKFEQNQFFSRGREISYIFDFYWHALLSLSELVVFVYIFGQLLQHMCLESKRPITPDDFTSQENGLMSTPFMEVDSK